MAASSSDVVVVRSFLTFQVLGGNCHAEYLVQMCLQGNVKIAYISKTVQVFDVGLFTHPCLKKGLFWSVVVGLQLMR